MIRQAAHDGIEQGRASSVREACRALHLTRSGYYRWRSGKKIKTGAALDRSARLAVLRVAGKWSRYGARRICAQLRREGVQIGMKRVRRLMREEGLIVKARKRFVRTTNSDHGFPIYPNLALSLKLTGINQLWVADLTYVHLGEGFIYVAVILDAFSRRAIGWDISKSLEDSLSIAALRMALRRRGAPKGLIHHSDRGSQYSSYEYTNILKGNEMSISMSRRANPYDNAKAESFMKTFKCDEVYLREYADEADARKHIHAFLSRIYNHERLHSALGYLPPAEFEKTLKEDPNPPELDPRGANVRQPSSTGETESGSAGMQPARDSRPGRRSNRLKRDHQPRRPSSSKNQFECRTPCLRKSKTQEAPTTAPGKIP